MFTFARNRNAMIAAGIVMFGQQFCGVNVIGMLFKILFRHGQGVQFCGTAYYSSTVFVQAGFSQVSALLSSFGFGLINWIFALPAVFTIDTFGRRYAFFQVQYKILCLTFLFFRNLLLVTFPCMAICLLITGFSFWCKTQKGLLTGVSLGICASLIVTWIYNI
jgi:hypothetical protein